MHTTLNKLRCGDAFQLELNGPVFVKCRGGFRPGRGGNLHACSPNQSVYRYRDAQGFLYHNPQEESGAWSDFGNGS